MNRETSKLGRCIRRYQYYTEQIIDKNVKNKDNYIIIRDKRLTVSAIKNCIYKNNKLIEPSQINDIK